MEFIAQYWFVWAILTVLFVWTTVSGPLKRIKRVAGAQSFGKAAGGMVRGLEGTFLMMLLAWVFGMLLVLSVILNIIAYIKG